MMDIDFGIAESQDRRLPIYLLIGTSSSMAGAPIQAVNQGINLLYNELMNDPSAIDTVYLAVITFDSRAQMVTPLTELTQFSPPSLAAGGEESAMGAALRLLREALDHDIVPNTPERKGDYKALVFLMTDSAPTDIDVWEREAKALKDRAKDIATIIALVCGGRVDANALKQLTDVVLMMHTVTPDMISQHFKWVSQSVSTTSVSAQAAGAGEAEVELPPPPKDVLAASAVEAEESAEEVPPQEGEPSSEAPAVSVAPPEAPETADVMVCVLDNGMTVECEAQPFAETGEGSLYWDKAGTYVVKLYKNPEPQLYARLQKIVGPEYNVTLDDPYWDQLFAWPKAIIKHPMLGVTMLWAPKGTMELMWFLGGKSRRVVAAKHGPDKLGNWTNNLSLAIKMARIVHRLHSRGLYGPYLCIRDFLVDPQHNRVVFIGWDPVVVPGFPRPSALDTLTCMAPELVTQTTSPGKKVAPSPLTDVHSLATLIYWLLLQRHPLVGPKEHSPDPSLDETLALGERALFIEHPTDTSNRPDNLPVPYTSMLTPAVQRLVERAFVEGLYDPESRPTAAEWERDLVRMADSIVPCSGPRCPLKAFVMPQATPVRCPTCDTLLNNPPVLPILRFYRPVVGSKGQFQNDDGYILVGWPGRTLQVWHTDASQSPGPGVDTTSVARLEFDAAEKRWSLINEATDGLRILKENGNHERVPVGSSCELVDGLRLLLGQADEARLALVQLQRLRFAS